MRWPWQEQTPAVKESSRAISVRKAGPVDSIPTDLVTSPLSGREAGGGSTLTEEQREVLLQLLGQFRSLREIQSAFQERFHFYPNQFSIHYYLRSKKWAPVIRAFRMAFLTKTVSVPIANKVIRMERLEMLYQSAMARGKHVEALHHLRAAAEEMDKIEKQVERGNVYINQQIAYFDKAQCEKRFAELSERFKQLEAVDGTSTRVSEAGTVISDGEESH